MYKVVCTIPNTCQINHSLYLARYYLRKAFCTAHRTATEYHNDITKYNLMITRTFVEICGCKIAPGPADVLLLISPYSELASYK